MSSITVRDLIQILQTKNPNLPVAVSQWSEYRLLELNDIVVEEHCKPRPDGWIQRGDRDDLLKQEYLIIE